MAKNSYGFTVNADEVARQIGQEVEGVIGEIQSKVQGLAIQTHAKVIEFATEELKGYQLETFLGKGAKNVRWTKASNNLWVVEIDESVGYFEDGRPSVSMATDKWLLKNAKTAKDNSKYKVIPFTHDLKGKGTDAHGTAAVLNTMAKNAVRVARTADNKRIPLYKIEKNPDGTVKTGIVHKIPVNAPFSQSQAPNLYSKPRTADEAKATGLKAHAGIFKLQGLVISQRDNGNGRIKREGVTFRVVSSKHQSEHRWMAPEIKPGNYLQKAFTWMEQEWPKILAGIGK